MTFLSVIKDAENKVEAFITKVVTEGEALVEETEAALTHVSVLIPQAAAAVEQASAFIVALPVVGQHPDVLAAVAAANVAMQTLNAFATVWNKATTGGGVTASVAKNAVLAGYQGYRSALAAANTAKAIAAGVAAQPLPVTPVAAPTAAA